MTGSNEPDRARSAATEMRDLSPLATLALVACVMLAGLAISRASRAAVDMTGEARGPNPRGPVAEMLGAVQPRPRPAVLVRPAMPTVALEAAGYAAPTVLERAAVVAVRLDAEPQPPVVATPAATLPVQVALASPPSRPPAPMQPEAEAAPPIAPPISTGPDSLVAAAPVKPVIDWLAQRRRLLSHKVKFRIDTPEDCVPPELRMVLYDVAERFGPVRIVSTHRDPLYNRRVGGASRSLHLHCDAVDFIVDTRAGRSTIFTFLRARPEVGGLGYYDHTGHYHIDVGPVRSW